MKQIVIKHKSCQSIKLDGFTPEGRAPYETLVCPLTFPVSARYTR